MKADFRDASRAMIAAGIAAINAFVAAGGVLNTPEMQAVMREAHAEGLRSSGWTPEDWREHLAVLREASREKMLAEIERLRAEGR